MHLGCSVGMAVGRWDEWWSMTQNQSCCLTTAPSGVFSLGRRMVSGPSSGGITLGEEVVCLAEDWRSRWACRAVATTGMPGRPSSLCHMSHS
jgi:hypothetical protein